MKTTSVTGELADRTETARLFPVLFMFLSFGNMIICLGLISSMHHYLAYVICAALYVGVIAIELRSNIRSPISISMLFIYLGLAVLDHESDDFKGYAGIIVFSWLTVITVTLLLLRKPFTSFYSSGRGMPQLHYSISAIWSSVYFCSLLASILLMPHVLFLIVPYLLCISCGLFTIYLNLVWFGRRNSLQQQFAIGDIAFRKIYLDTPEFDGFCRFYAEQIYRPDDQSNPYTLEQITASVATVERTLGVNANMYIAEHDGRIVGCIRCIIDKKGKPFPLERDLKVSLDPLRKVGKVLYVGRLAVDPAYRERPDVLSGLFKCFVDLSLSRDISFVVAEGFSHRLPTYLKLGFEILFERSDHRFAVKMSHGYVCHPVFLNFSRLIFNRSESAQKKYQFSECINRYLVERWYKRTALRYVFRSPHIRPWHFSLQQIRTFINNLSAGETT